MSDKIKVLFLAANPADTAHLQLDEELRAIFAALREGDRSQFDVAVAPALRATELPTVLLRENPDLIHYSGHGSKGQILLAADADNMEPVGTEDLARIFKTFANRTRCVVLNACFSATVAEAISASVPVVVGMSRAVPDRGACEFAAGFYSALATGGSLVQSFAAGQERLGRSGSPRDLAQLQAKEGAAEGLYFTGPLARRPQTPPPPQKTGYAALGATPIDFQPLADYAREHGFVSSNHEQIQEVGSISISGKSHRVSFSANSVVGSPASGPSAAVAANLRQVAKFGDLNVSGEGHEFASTLNAATGQPAAAAQQEAAALREKARARLDSLHRAIAGSSELLDEVKAAGKSVVAKLLARVDESPPNGDEPKKLLKGLRTMLSDEPELLAELADLETLLRQLR